MRNGPPEGGHYRDGPPEGGHYRDGPPEGGHYRDGGRYAGLAGTTRAAGTTRDGGHYAGRRALRGTGRLIAGTTYGGSCFPCSARL